MLSGMVSTLSLSDARVDQQGKQLLMSGMTLFLTISKCDPTHLMLQSARFIHENAFRVISILNKEVNNEPAGVVSCSLDNFVGLLVNLFLQIFWNLGL